VKDNPKISFKQMLHSKTTAKQFGNENCKSISKLSKIIGRQFISMDEKHSRISSKNRTTYKRPDTPTNIKKFPSKS
jgi:hypothetical protein